MQVKMRKIRWDSHIHSLRRKIYIPWISHIKWSPFSMNPSTINKTLVGFCKLPVSHTLLQNSIINVRIIESPGPSSVSCFWLCRWWILGTGAYESICFSQKSDRLSGTSPEMCLLFVSSSCSNDTIAMPVWIFFLIFLF